MPLLETALGRIGLYDRVARATHRVRKPELAERRRQLLEFHRPFIHRGSLVFDIGANDGRLARIYLELGANVVAVEPNPELAARLVRRYRVTIEEAAVGGAPGTAELHLATADVLSTLSIDWIETTRREGISTDWTGDSVQVAVTTLDDLIAKHGAPDYLKVDVEGFEEQVFAGLSQPLPLVSFEFQAANPDGALRCVERLSGLGDYEFRHTVLDELAFRTGWEHPKRVRGWLADVHAAYGVTANGDIFARLR